MARKQHVKATSPLKDFDPAESEDTTEGRMITSIARSSDVCLPSVIISVCVCSILKLN